MTKSSFFIIGKHAVIEALKNPKRKVLRLFLTEESKKTIHRLSPSKNLLKDIKIFFKTKKELDKYSKNDGIQHQGFVAEIEHLEQIELKKFIKNKTDITLVCLDEIERELSSEDLMINNAVSPMCIAGVYGGLDSGVNNNCAGNSDGFIVANPLKSDYLPVWRLDPQKGTIAFSGESILGKDPDVIALTGIDHVPEGREDIPFLTVDENLKMGAFTRKDNDIKADIDAVYDYFPALKSLAKAQRTARN